MRASTLWFSTRAAFSRCGCFTMAAYCYPGRLSNRWRGFWRIRPSLRLERRSWLHLLLETGEARLHDGGYNGHQHCFAQYGNDFMLLFSQYQLPDQQFEILSNRVNKADITVCMTFHVFDSCPFGFSGFCFPPTSQ